MSLSVGIVGLPNVGKSTLFNALLKKQQAYVANFPFATIEPNIGVVPVPDGRLKKLAEVVKESEGMSTLPPEVPATVEFVDIAGLIEGAHKGEGLGNKFLAHIRECAAICFVLRAFTDPEVVKQGVKDPKSDLEILKIELELADAQTIEAHAKKKNQNVEELPLLSKKPFLVVLNIDEEQLKNAAELEEKFAAELGVDKNQVVGICAKTEADLAGLSENEQSEYLKSLGVIESALDRLIKKAFTTLGLITFLTAGEKEVRAWTIKEGTNAQAASGVIHTDFIKNFIMAEVIQYDELIKLQTLQASLIKAGGGNASIFKYAKDQGKVRSEGRDYIVRDGDVIEFKIGT